MWWNPPAGGSSESVLISESLWLNRIIKRLYSFRNESLSLLFRDEQYLGCIWNSRFWINWESLCMCVCWLFCVSVLYDGARNPVLWSGWHVVETDCRIRSFCEALSSGGLRRTALSDVPPSADSQALNTLGITEISLLMPSKGGRRRTPTAEWTRTYNTGMVMIHWFTDSLSHWLTQSLTHSVTDSTQSLSHRFTESQIHWVTDSLSHRFHWVHRFTESQIHWVTDSLSHDSLSHRFTESQIHFRVTDSLSHRLTDSLIHSVTDSLSQLACIKLKWKKIK